MDGLRERLLVSVPSGRDAGMERPRVGDVLGFRRGRSVLCRDFSAPASYTSAI